MSRRCDTACISRTRPLKEGRNPRRAPPSSAGPRQYSQAAFRTNGCPVTTGLRNPHIGVDDVSGDKDLGRVLEVYPFETPTENRKVGGSTPPLATTIAAGQEAPDLRFCHFQGCDSGLSVAAIDRQIPRFAVRCCTELRSESFGGVRPTVRRHPAGLASDSSGGSRPSITGGSRCHHDVSHRHRSLGPCRGGVDATGHGRAPPVDPVHPLTHS